MPGNSSEDRIDDTINYTDFRMSRLLVVKNALEAVVLGGANLLAAPGWCVICDSGEKDGGKQLFYKNMSNMGIYDYYYGFGDKYSNIQILASNYSWCFVGTTNAELLEPLKNMFPNNDVQLIHSGDDKLQPKLNRYKTIIVQSIESKFRESENPEEFEYQKKWIPMKQLGGLQTITSSQVTELHKLLKQDLYVEFTRREDFTTRKVLTTMIENKSKLKNILYIPTETTTPHNYELLKQKIPLIHNLDFIFVDNRPTTTIADQYFYNIDLDQPIILQNNARTRKLIAFLETMDELQTFFKEGYQFVSSLRMCPLNRIESSEIHIIEKQEGGMLEELEEFAELGIEMEDFDESITQPTDFFETTQDVAQEGGLFPSFKKRKTIKHRKRLTAS
jgi:hypothetical protein